MKFYLKVITLLLVITMILPVQAMAVGEKTYSESVICYDDGSYLTIEIVTMQSRAATSKIGSKVYTYYGSDGNEDWKATLRGAFTYTGSTSTCTASICDVSITNTNWYVESKKVGTSGGTATAQLTMTREFLGLSMETKVVNMSLTCDANGNLS